MARRGFTPRRWIPVGAVLSLLFVWVLALRVSLGPGEHSPVHIAQDSQAWKAVRRANVASVSPTAPRPSPRAAPEETPVAERRERDQGPERPGEADRLFDDLRILRIEVEISPESEAVLGGWKWRRRSSPRPQVKATVREGGRVYRDVALHLKGSAGSFRPIDENPGMTLKFDKHVPEQRFHGLKKLSLNNSVQDASYLSEKICREIFLEAGVPAPRAAHALVTLNTEDLGLYVLVEGANKQFLKRHFPNTSGNLFDGGFLQDITEHLDVNSGDHPEDHSSLERLREAAFEPDHDLRLKMLEEVLDVDRFLAFVALETILWHWDGYTMNRNNYRIFHDVESGRMVFLPHGLDQTFGTGRGARSQRIPPRTRGMLAGAILQTEAGERRYLVTLTRLHRKVFDPDRIVRRADEVARPILAALEEAHPDRVDSFVYRVEELKDAIWD
ncbi:MAG TPA: CotH kinase family protein, partial [Planctomycetota bacterium]|nr:CotH kinase family protein [Planctomycetota bacterium]